MKKIFAILLVLFVFTAPSFSQIFKMAESNNYRVYSEISEENAQFIATAMDEFFNLYNRYFHFDESNLKSKLQIRIFQSKEGFDNYLSPIIPETSSSYVFLQYKNTQKSELVIYVIDDIEKMTKALVHHGFVQFIKTFIPGPPLWIQKGFAIYFEKSLYNDEDNTAMFRNNLDWAVTLKKYIAADKKDPLNPKMFTIPELLTIDTATANKNINVFYAESWGLVSFLINAKYQEYNRILWDSISAMKPGALKSENELTVITSAFKWIDNSIFLTDFYYYAESFKTFNELVKDGIKAYSDGSFDEAERIFITAMLLEESSYVPYYYLGLINYARKDYSMAEYYYQSTIEMGGNPDLTYYALGVNSYANNNSEDAVFYLSKVGSGEYFSKSTELLNSMSGDIEETLGKSPETQSKSSK